MERALEAYALWAVGLVVLGFTLVQAARTGSGLSFSFPRLTGRQLSTIVGWLLLAVGTLVVVARQK